MSTEDENKAGLVPSQSAALSRSGTTSLIRRGTQDLLARDEAEHWYKRGLELSAQEQHEEAALWYRKAAERGLAAAQFSLGWAYTCGRGVPQDDKQAALWYCKGAPPVREGQQLQETTRKKVVAVVVKDDDDSGTLTWGPPGDAVYIIR